MSRLLSLLLLVGCVPLALAEESPLLYPLSGRVLAPGVTPDYVGGATIVAKWDGGEKEIVSESDGTYRLDQPARARVQLVFSYTGYLPFQHAVTLESAGQVFDACLLRETMTVVYWRAAAHSIARLSDTVAKDFWNGTATTQLPVLGRVTVAAVLTEQKPSLTSLVPGMKLYGAQKPEDVERFTAALATAWKKRVMVPKPAELSTQPGKAPSSDIMAEIVGEFAAQAEPHSTGIILDAYKNSWGNASYQKALKASQARQTLEPRYRELLIYQPPDKTVLPRID